ncbi:MAG: PQQ-dependent sugar dehydrogenase [Actinomycetota bacterium]|nr:PQQ-dependent sugar dehydrogenase [Actinomycetota bacterium]
MPRVAYPLVALASMLALAACGAGAQAGAPTWVPAPSFNGEGQQPSAIPNVPIPSAPSSPGAPNSPAPQSSSASPVDGAVVATQLTSPNGIVILPDGSALVGERTTGRIVQVQPQPNHPVLTVRTLTGLSTRGGGGLLDLALSPTYAQDNLIFAYITTATDNRVVDFTLNGPVTPVLTGIPIGGSDNSGRITFGSDNQLYVGTGDAGEPSLAADSASLAGKVLRVSEIGQPATGNPYPSSPVFASGHRDVVGLCTVPTTDLLLAVDIKGLNGRENVNVLSPGANYGWPNPSGSSKPALSSLPVAYSSPGGCAVVDGTFYVTSLDGTALLGASLTLTGAAPKLSTFTVYLHERYGRLLNVIAAPDGALWLTTSNRDGHGKPVAADERVLRIPPPAGHSAYPG